MKVKIIKSSGSKYWYVDHIGEMFDVIEYGILDYRVKDELYLIKLIEKQDCEIIETDLTPSAND